MANLQLTETNLIGYLQSTLTASATSITAIFYDKITGLQRTPQATTLMFVIDKGTVFQPNTNYEIVLATSHSTVSGVTTLTGLTRGLSFSGNTLVGGTGKAHVANAEIGTVDVHYLWNLAANKLLGNDTFNNSIDMGTHAITGVSTPTSFDLDHAANVDYVNNVVIGGGADASTTVKGIAKISKAPVVPTNPITVGDNDERIGFDAVVASSGGNYTTIGAALAANKRRIFVKNGTYAETEWNLTTVTYIEGESETNVVVNMTQTLANFISGVNGITIKKLKMTIDTSYNGTARLMYIQPLASTNHEIKIEDCYITINKRFAGNTVYALVGDDLANVAQVGVEVKNNRISVNYGIGGTGALDFYTLDSEDDRLLGYYENNYIEQNCSDATGQGTIVINGKTIAVNNVLLAKGAVGTVASNIQFSSYSTNINNTCYSKYNYIISGVHTGGTYNILNSVSDTDFTTGTKYRFQIDNAKMTGCKCFNDRNGDNLVKVTGGSNSTIDSLGSMVEGNSFDRGLQILFEGCANKITNNDFLELGLPGNTAVVVSTPAAANYNTITGNRFSSHQGVTSGTNTQAHTIAGAYNQYRDNICLTYNDVACSVPTITDSGTGNSVGNNITSKYV